MNELAGGHVDVPVVIVGAGPVGVSTAILLAQRGVDALVVDRQETPYPLPRAVHVDDEIFRVLQDMGIAERFAEISMPTLGLRLIDGRQRTMAEFRRSDPVGPFGYPPANMFDQPDLERLLRERLAHYAGTTLAGGTEVVGVEQDAQRDPHALQVRLRSVTSGAEHLVRTRAVLGCDGANSTVRRIIGARMEDLGFEERWVVIDASSGAPLPIWQGVHQLCDPRRAGTLMQVGPGRYRWEFQLLDGENANELLTNGTLGELVQPWLGDLRFADLELIRHAEYTFRARIADRWRDGRIFLLGDAAHVTPPFIGQGLCAGLRDAANLSWKLAAVLQGQAADRLLDSYEPERKPHARALIRKAVTVGWAMTGGQDKAAHVRRLALAVATRIPSATDKLLDAAPPRLPDGIAICRRGRRDRLAGSQIPQPCVSVGGRRMRLDEVTGPSYAVVLDGEPDPGLLAAAQEAGAGVVRLVPPPSGRPAEVPYTVAVDEDGGLLEWMRRGRTGALLVRPDHVVQAAERLRRGNQRRGVELAEYLRAWTRALSWTAARPAPMGGRS